MIDCKNDLHGLCSVENQRRKDWVQKHRETCPLREGAPDFVRTAGHQICLRPSSVGDSVTILCDCGAKEDVSHYEHT